MSNQQPPKFFVTPECAAEGANRKTNKPWRRQDIMVHANGEVRRIVLRFLGKDDRYMDQGEYRLAPDAVYVGDVYRPNDDGTFNKETGLRVSMRPESFVKVPASTTTMVAKAA